jgi:hypothetical protein
MSNKTRKQKTLNMRKKRKTKQWPLDSEFVEFEYSPEIRHFCRIRELAKMVFLENRSDSLNSSTFANLFCSDPLNSSTFVNLFSRTRQTRRHSPTYFPGLARLADICQKAFFEKNVTHLDTFARVIRHSRKFGASGHCLRKT